MKHRAVKRRSVVIGIGATAGVAAVGGVALTAQAESTKGVPSASGTESGSSAQLGGGKPISLPRLGLAAGYVVVEPGARGRTLKDSEGEYYGTAPAGSSDAMAGDINNEFGAGTEQYRHFTLYSLRKEKGAGARLASDIPEKLRLVNPMYHLVDKPNPGRARHWWIRLGSSDSDTSLTVSANLAAAAHQLGDEVSHLYYWDAGHGANEDAGDFIEWIAGMAGYQAV
ncbi:hypothetical protein ACFY3N_19945 [Streptomyces sp. NPDC000348]|uniref:hypothetical protein n=1 Tax=Streptomyces sp. NPDC000348 TaxID=3364538 RepID=UPI0036C73092